jgi:Kef-type K+ transport system membrane component KefB
MVADTTTSDISDPNDEDYFAGVPTTPEDLYVIMLFFLVLYLVGDCFCSRVLKIVPSLVGYILVGIAFGPEGFDLLSIGGSNCAVENFVVLGNLGLVLLIVQAGLEMDYETLRMVGLRGVIIAIAGTILPVTIGTAIAFRYLDDWKSAFAAGCSFGPTSAGIAMNVLGQCRILSAPSPPPASSLPNAQSDNNSDGDGEGNGNDDKGNSEGNILQLPVGQLIVAAAIVDDILALVILSQLQALRTTTTALSDDETDNANKMAMDIAIPIVSAFLWLVAGGAIALWVFPKGLKEIVDRLSSRYPDLKDANGDGSVSLVVLFGLLYTLLPATYFSRSSYLLGAFLSGLAFCQDHSGVDESFRRQFKRPMSYLMKLFFAASIGFQVPVQSFGDATIIARGFLFALALMGKLAVGLLTPNFYDRTTNCDDGGGNCDDKLTKRFRGRHLRDCLVVGFSMMGEAEFAFVVAVFGVSEGLVPPDVYASIVWAILLSTVISPLLLKITLAFFPYHGVVGDYTRACEKLEEEEQDRTIKAINGNLTSQNKIF